ncbi:hypothetical protein J6590_054051 [Homalodisca vitripennis]|nr:hypothetical protein J6590_054051 [Homalodisca vitripennis]
MCLDLWFDARRPLQQRTIQQSHNSWVQYTLYSILGWGVPTFFCTVTSGVGVEPFVTDSCPIPRLRRDACFFNRDRTAQLFLYIPVDVMMQLDVLMIVSLKFNITKHLFQAVDVTSETIQKYAQSTKKSKVYCRIAIFLMVLHWFYMLLLKQNRALTDTFGLTAFAMLLSIPSFLGLMVLFYL